MFRAGILVSLAVVVVIPYLRDKVYDNATEKVDQASQVRSYSQS